MLNRYGSLYGSAVDILTNRSKLPTLGANGAMAVTWSENGISEG